jgi:SAM-dependent methyltransferase
MRKDITLSVLPSKWIGIYPFGLLCFRFGLVDKWFGSLNGKWTQRLVEYPWVIDYLQTLDENSLVLGVGCAESLFGQELVLRRFRVVGLDFREPFFPNKYIKFVKGNALNIGLPTNLFDAIFVISTIEHIGLDAYHQVVKDTEGDLQAIKEFTRILKKNGKLIITTPYIGSSALHISAFERHYNRERLEKLIEHLRVLKEDYFYPYMTKRRLRWLKTSKTEIDSLPFQTNRQGIACLVLSK